MRARASGDESALLFIAMALAPAFAVLQVLLFYRFGVGPGLLLYPVFTLLGLIFWKPVIGIYAALLAIPLETLSLNFGPGGLSPTEGLFLLTATAIAVRSAIGYRSEVRSHPAFTALAALLAIIALGLFYAQDTVIVGKILVDWTSFFIVAVYVGTLERVDIERAFLALSIAGGIVGVIAVSNSGQQEALAGAAVVTGRAQAGFQHPNVLAFFLVLTLPGALVLAARGVAWRRVLTGVCAALVLAGLVLTLTRGAIIGALLSLLLLLGWAPFRRFFGILLLGLMLFSAVNFKRLEQSQEFSVVSERLATFSHPEQTSGDRVQIYKTVPKMVADHPFLGVGMGNFSIVSPNYGLRDVSGAAFDHAHNVVLTMAVELGLLGLAVFLLVSYLVARAAARALRNRGSPDFPLALASASALIGIAGASISDVPYRTNAITGVLMLHIGALVAADRRADKRRMRHDRNAAPLPS